MTPPAAAGTTLALIGPTGVGKTAVAVALAARRPVEVVGVDSRQVYRGLDLGSGKPTRAERLAVPHHLIDWVDPDDVYDVARFVRDASVVLARIRDRGRTPLLVGGTGLYYRALVRGLAPRPPANGLLRAQLAAVARAEGAEALHRRLAIVDPASAARLHPHDVVRVTRALEVASGPREPLEEPRGGLGRGSGEEGWWGAGPRLPVLTFGLTLERRELYRRLDERVDRMVAGGLLGEVAGLLAGGIPENCPAMQGIGYRHLVPVVRGEATLAGAVAGMKRDTRRYARRQVTWFTREAGVTWLDVAGREPGDVADEIAKSVERARVFD